MLPAAQFAVIATAFVSNQSHNANSAVPKLLHICIMLHLFILSGTTLVRELIAKHPEVSGLYNRGVFENEGRCCN